MNKTKLFLAAMILFFVFGAASLSYAQAGKKAVFVIAEKNFQDDEFSKPRGILTAAGISVTVASTTLKEAKGTNGARVKPDVLLKDVKAAEYDAVVFIGGPGAQQYLDDHVAHALAGDAVAQKKIVGAICLAPVILANAGLLTGKKATCFPTLSEEMRQSFVAYTGKPVEKEGSIITADGPQSAAEFGKELVTALQGGK